jgi:hypothetical protein
MLFRNLFILKHPKFMPKSSPSPAGPVVSESRKLVVEQPDVVLGNWTTVWREVALEAEWLPWAALIKKIGNVSIDQLATNLLDLMKM